MTHIYDNHFMDYTGDSSRHSAMTIASLLREPLVIGSVLDVGCATGTWLRAWLDTGVGEIQGVDGDYVDRSRLRIEGKCFRSADLSQPLVLGRRFDLVQSLEVAEHIDESCADRFVQNLVDHSRGLVLFSAAPPGQGGEYHINEQPLEYWRRKFARHDYQVFDAVRPAIAADASISFWYRYNTLLYVHADRFDSLPASIAASRIGDASRIPDPAPLVFRARKLIVRAMPYSLQQALARFKARWMSRRAGSG